MVDILSYQKIKYLENKFIKNLNLIELDASYNKKITNVNHMTKLQKLYANSNCGLNDEGIKDLNLIELLNIIGS